MITDEKLMRRVCDGDERAYRLLVSRHITSIGRYTMRLLNGRQDYEDISQEVFLRLWLKAKTWDPKSAKLSTWLHRIAFNLCMDYFRRPSQRESHSDLKKSDIDAVQALDEPVNDVAQRFRQLEKLISELPESQRSATTLVYQQGFANKEASEIMGISVKALESLLSRSRKTLRVLVSSESSKAEKSSPLEKEEKLYAKQT